MKLGKELWGFMRHPNKDGYEECPVCRHGTLSQMLLMDTMSCDFCRHIFSIDTDQPLAAQPVLRLEDAAQPLVWQWTGQHWKALPRAERPLVLWLWILCAAIAVIPSSLMGLAIYIFPAAPQSKGAWFASVWLGLTLGFHVLLSLWLLAEHYQWPIYNRLKLLFERGGFRLG